MNDMDIPHSLTPAQKEVLLQVEQLLGEHFDQHALVVFANDLGPSGRDYAYSWLWKGAVHEVEGLFRYGVRVLEGTAVSSGSIQEEDMEGPDSGEDPSE